jgi:4-hydroxy-tetrahydrodipicolinate synthase
MITPFLDNGDIDFHAIPYLVDYYAKTCDGIFAVCQSSEMFFMSLEERAALAEAVLKASAGRIPVVVSGHISDSPDDQAEEARRMVGLGADAFVLVSNRLAAPEESDDIWIDRLDRLTFSVQGCLGLYECPYPYKRLLSEKALKHLSNNKRFTFFKDTCCNAEQIKARVGWLNGSALRLLNANTETLLQSLRDGAYGFSGVMANFHPELYQWLCAKWQVKPQVAQNLQDTLTALSLVERYGYPACAKMHLRMLGLPIGVYCRNGAHKNVPVSMPDTLRQMIKTETQLREELCVDYRIA